MKPLLLSPVGRAEPDDIQGWLEQGGGLGLQLALRQTPAALRAILQTVARRDGQGKVELQAGMPAQVTVEAINPVHQYLAAELPYYLLEGALIRARALEQPDVMVRLESDAETRALWQEVLAKLTSLGIIGADSVTGIEIHLSANAEEYALDALTARLIPLLLTEHSEPQRTLLAAVGKFCAPSVYEIPLGLSLRDFVFHWAGGIPPTGQLALGDYPLSTEEWNLPLTFDQWGIRLGSGVLQCL